MPSNKDRLYIGLYICGGQSAKKGAKDRYHWALLTGPKVETNTSLGMRYHAKNIIEDQKVEWRFEGVQARIVGSCRLLVRVMIAKIEDGERLSEILHKVPVRATQPGWNCVSWVKEALEQLREDGRALGRSVLEWDRVRDVALEYCQRKKDEHRFDGTREIDTESTATYDLLSQREITS